MNIKNISRIIITILLLVFSFYYTDKSIDLIKQSDPIMKQIKENSSQYIIKILNEDDNVEYSYYINKNTLLMDKIVYEQDDKN